MAKKKPPITNALENIVQMPGSTPAKATKGRKKKLSPAAEFLAAREAEAPVAATKVVVDDLVDRSLVKYIEELTGVEVSVDLAKAVIEELPDSSQQQVRQVISNLATLQGKGKDSAEVIGKKLAEGSFLPKGIQAHVKSMVMGAASAKEEATGVPVPKVESSPKPSAKPTVEAKAKEIVESVPEATVPDPDEVPTRKTGGKGGAVTGAATPKEPKKIPLAELIKQFQKAGGKPTPEMLRDLKREQQLRIAEAMEAQGIKVPTEAIDDSLPEDQQQTATKKPELSPEEAKLKAEKKAGQVKLGQTLTALKKQGLSTEARRTIAALPPEVQQKFTTLPPERQKVVVEAINAIGKGGESAAGVQKVMAALETGAAEKPGYIARALKFLTGADALDANFGPTEAYKTEKAVADAATAAGQTIKGVTGRGAALARGARELTRGRHIIPMALVALMAKGFSNERAAVKEINEKGVVPSTGQPLKLADELLREANMERLIAQRKMTLQKDPELLGDVVRVLSGGDDKRITQTEVRIGNIPQKLKPKELNTLMDQFIRGLNDYDNIPIQ